MESVCEFSETKTKCINELENIIGLKRVSVRVIQDPDEIIFHSSQREILYTIKSLYPEFPWEDNESYVDWSHTLAVPIEYFLKIESDNFFNIENFKINYKKLYFDRIKMITDKYDSRHLSSKKQIIYNEAKKTAEVLKSSKELDFTEYNNLRAEFEKIRHY